MQPSSLKQRVIIGFLALGFGNLLMIALISFRQLMPDLLFGQLSITLSVLLIGLIVYGFVNFFRALVSPLIHIHHSLKALLQDGKTERVPVKGRSEVAAIGKYYNRLLSNIEQLTSFARSIEEGRFDAEMETLNEADMLGNALFQMRDKLQDVARQDKLRNWQTEGLARFADILRTSTDNLEDFSRRLIAEIVRYTESNQGSMFLAGEGENPTLELLASYAWDRHKFGQQSLQLGEGMAGQAWQEEETIYITEVPNDYVTISSGLGEANPNALIIIPMKLNDVVYGILELASFGEFEDHKRLFLEKLAESIASTIKNIRDNQNTKVLLAESQELTEEMRAQEEEMRQNMEELQATQEEMARKQDALTVSNMRTQAVFKNSMDAILAVSPNGLIEDCNPAAAQLFNRLDLNSSKMAISELIPSITLESIRHRTDKIRTEGLKTTGENLDLEVSTYWFDEQENSVTLVYVRDITDESKKEAAIAKTMKELQQINDQLETNQSEMKAQENVLIGMVQRFEDKEKELIEQLRKNELELEKIKGN